MYLMKEFSNLFSPLSLSLFSPLYVRVQVEYPTYWSVDEFCDGFVKLIDHLELTKVILYIS